MLFHAVHDTLYLAIVRIHCMVLAFVRKRASASRSLSTVTLSLLALSAESSDCFLAPLQRTTVV
jgi:hypothetical protein